MPRADPVNEMELRMARAEQQLTGIEDFSIETFFDEDGVQYTEDPLIWQSGWESWARLKVAPDTGAPPDEDDPDPHYLDADWVNPSQVVTNFGPASVYMIGAVCFLTGVVRRVAPGATVPAATRANSPMFLLPDGWRPVDNAILPCICATSVAPDSTSAPGFGLAWVEVRVNDTQDAGMVYLASTSVALNQNAGWIFLTGSFRCQASEANA